MPLDVHVNAQSRPGAPLQDRTGMSSGDFPVGASRYAERTDRPASSRTALHRQVNLAGVDLNLLVALEALLTERNVTIAAGRVGLSQPAMSRALGRLRALFEDDLLVRSSSGFVLTRRAEQLASELPGTMAALRLLLSNTGSAVDADHSILKVAMPDHQSLIYLQRLLDRSRIRAPHVDLILQSLTSRTMRQLEAGEIDLAVGSMRGEGTGFYRRLLYRDRFACLLRNGHPILSQAWNADRFATLRHSMVTSPAEEGFAQVYEALADLQFLGNDPLMVPNASSAPFIVAETDIALVLPLRVARRAAALLPLTVLEVPIELPPYEVSLLWHERGHRDPDCAQLRADFAAISLEMVETATPRQAAPA
jgi:DNA-binding transcriptional LysR family regulator